MDKILSKHAKEQMRIRGISEDIIWKIISDNKIFTTENGVTIYHGFIQNQKKLYLIRIFVNESVNPNLVITVYRTSKINKYK
jgi:hypothetical protein